ncbi:MAG: xanthine dehydrogenase [Bacillota bacterium]|jgi:xanthine dehydrogenase accessory factor|nr:xanthine dehydrogenase [Bacillota bacterium]
MHSNIYRKLKDELDHGSKAVVLTWINHPSMDASGLPKSLLTQEKLFADPLPEYFDVRASERVNSSFDTGCPQLCQSDVGYDLLIEPYYPVPQLIILGGGAVAKPLSELGAKVGFTVTVIDDKPMYANKDRFPEAENVICADFSDCFEGLALNGHSFVVIVTREHRHDLECLRQILNRKTAYAGMIGSKESLNRVKEQLLKEGFSGEQIDQVHMPVGLDIGADSPEEIAVSIIAEIIGCRRFSKAKQMAGEAEPFHYAQTDKMVLDELCRQTEEPKAIATIIETQGSVPRKAGTKMLIWSYGMTVGSIGGGYAEGELINTAWQIIGTGKSLIYEIDLTGQAAEEEGMVCGGTMKILIEDC